VSRLDAPFEARAGLGGGAGRLARADGGALAITSSGAFRKFETHVLMTQHELLEALEKAAEIAYTAPAAEVHV
jgi:hypothetical protein